MANDGVITEPALRALAVVCGTAMITLGILAAVASIEGTDGPTRLLRILGYTWEMIFTAAIPPLIAAMWWISHVTRSTAAWVLTVLGAVAMITAAVAAVLRLAGVIDVFLPLANWLPATLLIMIWSAVASRAAVRAEVVPRSISAAAAVVLAVSVGIVAVSTAAILSTGTRVPVVNITAGAASGAIWAALGVWWLALAALWRSDTRRG